MRVEVVLTPIERQRLHGIPCQICSKKLLHLASHLRHIHSLSVPEYREIFGKDTSVAARMTGTALENVQRAARRPERRRKLSEAKRGVPKSEQAKERMRGPRPSVQKDKNPAKRPEVRAKISKARKGVSRPDIQGDKNPSCRPEARRKKSITASQNILEGKPVHRRRGKSGYFWSEKNQRKLHYRSSLELLWYQVLEQLDEVRGYRVEPVAILYLWEGSVHRYHPDLLVSYQSGRTELVEIRPEMFRSDLQSQAKFEAARQWCAECRRPVQFKLLGYEDLKIA